jgi:hypothetical protein
MGRKELLLLGWRGKWAYTAIKQESTCSDLLPSSILCKHIPTHVEIGLTSQLERDKWVWAINAEKERMVRSHLEIETRLRNYDKIPKG